MDQQAELMALLSPPDGCAEVLVLSQCTLYRLLGWTSASTGNDFAHVLERACSGAILQEFGLPPADHWHIVVVGLSTLQLLGCCNLDHYTLLWAQTHHCHCISILPAPEGQCDNVACLCVATPLAACAPCRHALEPHLQGGGALLECRQPDVSAALSLGSQH